MPSYAALDGKEEFSERSGKITGYLLCGARTLQSTWRFEECRRMADFALSYAKLCAVTSTCSPCFAQSLSKYPRALIQKTLSGNLAFVFGSQNAIICSSVGEGVAMPAISKNLQISHKGKTLTEIQRVVVLCDYGVQRVLAVDFSSPRLRRKCSQFLTRWPMSLSFEITFRVTKEDPAVGYC